MPTRPLRPCTYPRCPALTSTGRCDAHQRQKRKRIDERRGTAAQRGYGSKWQKARLQYLAEHPLCECAECTTSGAVVAAEVVDHIIPHRGDAKLFWDRKNWCAMSKPHHDRKTARGL